MKLFDLFSFHFHFILFFLAVVEAAETDFDLGFTAAGSLGRDGDGGGRPPCKFLSLLSSHYNDNPSSRSPISEPNFIKLIHFRLGHKRVPRRLQVCHVVYHFEVACRPKHRTPKHCRSKRTSQQRSLDRCPCASTRERKSCPMLALPFWIWSFFWRMYLFQRSTSRQQRCLWELSLVFERIRMLLSYVFCRDDIR